MHAAERERIVRRLRREQRQLQENIGRLEENGLGAALSNTTGELSSYDNHPADLGSETFERSKDLALRDNEQVLLRQIAHALKRLETEQYGRCETCGCTIPPDRLAALPWATRCLACQAKEEQGELQSRPLEEQVLAPPFHRTFLDSARSEEVGYDGEDALQDVMRWGSSDTPQDIPGTYDYKALFPNSNEHQGIVDLADSIPDKPDARMNRYERRKK